MSFLELWINVHGFLRVAEYVEVRQWDPSLP